VIVPRLSDFAFSTVLDGIESAAAEAGQGLLVVGWDIMGDNLASKREILLHLLNDGIVDGVLIAYATIGDEFSQILSSSRVPIVVVNRKSRLLKSSVTVQDSEAVRIAVRHLNSLGHSRIGYIGLKPGTTTAADRLEGFRSGMRSMGLEIREEWVESVEHPDLNYQSNPLAGIFERSEPIGLPSALVVANVRTATSVFSELVEREINVPLQMSIIAIGENDLAKITTPRLTTVWLPFETMGRKSVEMLINAANGKELNDVQITELPEIIHRQSTAAPKK
jgi:DNA-binding LacI/PurR family transcriptional regulator